jgi:DNA segregation ATPase FtsK/SpoIIIE, S-DNA-T family
MAETESAGVFNLLRESRWLLLVACAIYLTMALYGFDLADTAWSHSTSHPLTHNPGGVLGAYLSDILLSLFGFSAWWWVLFMLTRVLSGYHQLSADSIFDKRTLWVSISGFMLLLLSSSTLEATRMYTLKFALRCCCSQRSQSVSACFPACPGCVLSTGWVLPWKIPLFR